MTVSLDLTASRNVAWAPTINLYYRGAPIPIAGGSVKLQVRLYAGAPGGALADLSNVPFLDTAVADQPGVRLLSLYPRITAATLKSFPTGLNKPEPGQADAYAYDSVVTYSDGQQDKLAIGAFILEPGVVNP
ncbi:hypothetical protein [uncultured Novosphingobium sp.]|uniref:hypothetical protein n=1 Tax=uncultured Novosphingobium sp. TaxID=292277 RepID=UPI0037482795